MPPTVKRGGGTYPVNFTADGSGSVVPFSAVSGAILVVVDGGGTIEWCVSDPRGGEVSPLINAEAQPCTQDVAAGQAYELPHAVYAADYLVARGADVTGRMCVKG
jgi:hypothetical protein